MSSRSGRPQAEGSDTAEAFRQACAAALRLLARREHSAQELRGKLTGRGYPGTLAEQVIEALHRENALSDDRFAESYARARFERGLGPLRIAAELRERGVAAALIETALAYADFDWVASALRQRHKRFGTAIPADFSERARQMRFLQQRGFSGDQIRRSLAGETDTTG